jgi:enolase
MTWATIAAVEALRVWDSRGRPTIEVEVRTTRGAIGRAIAPAGASRGSAEAVEARDGGEILGGLDVSRAVDTVRSVVQPALLGANALEQADVDALLDQLDPSPTRGELGGNVTTATSLAVLHAAAAGRGRPLWAHLNPEPAWLPRPEVQIIGGGAHASRRIDVQDFMVVPLRATSMEIALLQVAEVYRQVGMVFHERGARHGVADEGGHWPDVADNEEALDLVMTGIERAGLDPGRDMAISVDVAASEFERDGRYRLASEHAEYSRAKWLDILDSWASKYPICAIEDPVGERDTTGWPEATERLRRHAIVIGDDNLVTNASRVRACAQVGACTSALIKVNQAGTVTSARAAFDAAKTAGWSTVVSARSGETEDVTIAHLAVGWQADLIKVGSIARGERTAKWNELLRIEKALGGRPLARFPHERSSWP